MTNRMEASLLNAEWAVEVSAIAHAHAETIKPHCAFQLPLGLHP